MTGAITEYFNKEEISIEDVGILLLYLVELESSRRTSKGTNPIDIHDFKRPLVGNFLKVGCKMIDGAIVPYMLKFFVDHYFYKTISANKMDAQTVFELVIIKDILPEMQKMQTTSLKNYINEFSQSSEFVNNCFEKIENFPKAIY